MIDEKPVIEDDTPGDRIVSINGKRYIELPDNSYQLLFAWFAGPRHACRTVDDSVHAAMVTMTRFRERREDLRLVDDIVNSSLSRHGLPPRPCGYVWYVELPDKLTPDDVWCAVRLDCRPGVILDPLLTSAAMRDAVSELYGDDF
ncbi:DUF5956 family protein [Herbihabitans rhizosphaerae]|uniref:DUF5956 family protein n=1 Tax=Herbihabitans rhizosphaerae TaxID=1872711 RepID=UPI00102B993E|nr:DUF5956 family protein [Herbihabitans rhizosphaerae]